MVLGPFGCLIWSYMAHFVLAPKQAAYFHPNGVKDSNIHTRRATPFLITVERKQLSHTQKATPFLMHHNWDVRKIKTLGTEPFVIAFTLNNISICIWHETCAKHININVIDFRLSLVLYSIYHDLELMSIRYFRRWLLIFNCPSQTHNAQCCMQCKRYCKEAQSLSPFCFWVEGI